MGKLKKKKSFNNFWKFLALDQKFNNALKSFDLVFKVVGTDFGTRSKVLILVFLA